MGITERRERQKKEVRESILQSAWQIVNEDGWQTLSIRKIADAIEYSIPVVYDHFENKEAILFEFTKMGFGLLRDKLKETITQYPDPAQQLEAIAYAYWDFAFENKQYYQVMFGLGMPGCEQIRKMPEIMDFTGIIKTAVECILAKNGNTDADSFLKFNAFWSMLHGLVSINLMTPQAEHGGMDSGQFNKLILADFIKGFIKSLDK